ncbi:hypothetical protein HY311_03765 [Candidatus Nomurabacteria bacterium]|nr:hypothetical protein [Candidatus Nomurabacteria bacterium]
MKIESEWKKVPKPRLEKTYPKSPEDSKKLYDMNVALLNYLERYSGDADMQFIKEDFERSEEFGEKISVLKDALSVFEKETVDQVKASCRAQIDELSAAWLNKKNGEEVVRLIDIRLGNISGDFGVDIKKEADNFIAMLRKKPELWAFCNLLIVGAQVKKDLTYFRKVTETAIASNSGNTVQ